MYLNGITSVSSVINLCQSPSCGYHRTVAWLGIKWDVMNHRPPVGFPLLTHPVSSNESFIFTCSLSVLPGCHCIFTTVPVNSHSDQHLPSVASSHFIPDCTETVVSLAFAFTLLSFSTSLNSRVSFCPFRYRRW